MSKPRRYRWVCPVCDKAALGSSRPALNAIVRFCFPCSSKAGVLVETSAPALKAKRSAKASKTKAKRVRKKAKADAKWMRAGVDVRKEVKRCCKAACISVPEVSIRNSKGCETTGHSYGGRIVLSIPMGSTRGQALALIAHEVAHEAARWESHGPAWRREFLAIVREAYGVDAGDPGMGYMHLHEHVERVLCNGPLRFSR